MHSLTVTTLSSTPTLVINTQTNMEKDLHQYRNSVTLHGKGTNTCLSHTELMSES